MTDHFDSSLDSSELPNEISGRWVVLGIFIFAIVMIGVLYLYWFKHTGPFLPLQKALAEEFVGCQPLVQGGQRKIHKNTDKILRVTMKVEFNPLEMTESSEQYVENIFRFISNNWKISDYDELHLHVYKKNPEKKLQENVFKKNVKEYLAEKNSA